LLFLVGRMIVQKSKGLLHVVTGKYKNLERELERWNAKALNPEVESAFEAVTSAAFNTQFGKKDVLAFGGEAKLQDKENIQQINHHLLETENSLKQSISQLSLSSSHVL